MSMQNSINLISLHDLVDQALLGMIWSFWGLFNGIRTYSVFFCWTNKKKDLLCHQCRPEGKHWWNWLLLLHETSFTEIPLRSTAPKTLSLHIITRRKWITLHVVRNPAASRPWTSCPDPWAPYSGDGQVDWPDAELGEGIRPVYETLLKI